MDYKKLLGNYDRLTIRMKDIELLSDVDFLNIRFLNSDLGDLFNTFDIDDKIIKHLYIKPNGIEFILTNLIDILCEYFNIENDENKIDNLNNLLETITEKSIMGIASDSKLMKENYDNYKLKNFLPENTSNKKKKLHKNREFAIKTKSNIRSFIDLILNEKRYSTVNDLLFNEEKLNLYLAHNVMEYSKHCKKNQEELNYNYSLKYLIYYIENNKELLDNNFELNINNHLKYSIGNIQQYINSQNIIRKSSSELDVKKQKKNNYNFFECDKSKSREILKKIIRLIQENRDNDKLIDLLKRKIELYDSLNYINMKIGNDSYEGYIGFTLENGYVVLDKLFDNLKEYKIATKNAIYIIKETDFDKVTKMTKTQTMEAINLGTVEAKRIIHRGNFEDQVVKSLNLK